MPQHQDQLPPLRALTPGEMENHASIATTITGPQLAAYTGSGGWKSLLTTAAVAVVALNREAHRSRAGWAAAEVMLAGLAIQRGADIDQVVATLAERLSEVKGVRVTWEAAADVLAQAGPRQEPDDAELPAPRSEDDDFPDGDTNADEYDGGDPGDEDGA